jgi:dimethylglycine catabolism A
MPATAEYTVPTLLQPARLGPVALRNRIIMAPMTTRHADAEGFVTADTIAYFQARARGGVGLVTVEMAAPEKVGKHRNNELGLYDDRFLPGLTELVAAIHAEGAKASIQIGHGGGHTRSDICGEEPIAPSALPHSVHEGHTEIIVPQAMTLERIRQTQTSFVEAALRARKAGFDAVEIHAAHGYLISQFMAPGENIREDGYGGPLENRARFAIEIMAMTKAAVPDLAVTFRMNGDDFFPGGIGIKDAVEIAVWAAGQGADAIHVTGGHYRSLPTAAVMIPPMATGPTPFLAFAKAIKERVSMPVITVGRYGDPKDAMAVIDNGFADFVALGRPLLADADWVNKAGRNEQVRLCLACNSCVDGMRDGKKLHCLVNPVTGRERDFAQRHPARSGQSIAVIGGGPAGLNYALLAAKTNSVTLFEKNDQLGGGFVWAGLAPKFQTVEARPEPLLNHIEGLKTALLAAGVTIRTGCDPLAKPSLLLAFDHVVVATGAGYRFGLGWLIEYALQAGSLKQGWLKRLASSEWIRQAFYYNWREGRGKDHDTRLGAHPSVEVLGDARQAGKSEQAILAAYDAALKA